jgi:hypothetical protein
MKFIKNIYLRRFTYGLMAGMLVGGALGGYFISLYLFKPDFRLSALELTNTDEKQFDLAEQKDKPIVLNFLSRGCMPLVLKSYLYLNQQSINTKIVFNFILSWKKTKRAFNHFRKSIHTNSTIYYLRNLLQIMESSVSLKLILSIRDLR